MHLLVIIHHHTKFGKKNKWLSGSGDIEWTRSDTWTELQTDGWTDGQSDSNIPPVFIRRGYKKKRYAIDINTILNSCPISTVGSSKWLGMSSLQSPPPRKTIETKHTHTHHLVFQLLHFVSVMHSLFSINMCASGPSSMPQSFSNFTCDLAILPLCCPGLHCGVLYGIAKPSQQYHHCLKSGKAGSDNCMNF